MSHQRITGHASPLIARVHCTWEGNFRGLKQAVGSLSAEVGLILCSTPSSLHEVALLGATKSFCRLWLLATCPIIRKTSNPFVDPCFTCPWCSMGISISRIKNINVINDTQEWNCAFLKDCCLRTKGTSWLTAHLQ